MNKNIEYAKNTFILLLGKFATQFMSFLLLPLYTHFLLKEDYGAVDLIQTYISLLVPVLTLRFDSAVFRFLIDERKSKNTDNIKSIISNVLFTIIFMIIIFILIYLVMGLFVEIKYYWLIMVNIIAIMISNILLQVSRGIGKNKEYSIACIITGAVTLLINLYLIIFLKRDAGSILIASTIANILCCIYIIVKNNILKLINWKKFNRKKVKELLKYSLPMIPNALSWWIVNVSDRTIISAVLGTAFNGIYTVSSKFSNILNSIFSIFNMSWQESASLHINDEDKQEFFTTMINKLLNIFSCISLLLITIIPLTFDLLIGEEYNLSYNYIPILLFANIFQILIQLLGGIYIAMKMTKKIMNTTIISAIINIFINMLYIKELGLYAASISTFIAYFVMCIYRYIDIKKYIKIKLNFKIIVFLLIMFVISSIVYYCSNIYLKLINFVFVILVSIIINRDLLASLKKILTSKIKRKCKK